MATVLFLVAAATSHSPNVPSGVWWSCSDVQREHCISHQMPRHLEQKTYGVWEAKKGTRYVVYPYFKRHVKHVQRVAHSAYRQVTRAVQNVGQTFWYLTTGYGPGCGATGATASGIWPHAGTAAATLPFGVRGYVPGYGNFVVEDRGGAIGPGRLDLYFGSCGEAIAWGVRSLQVQIYG